MIDVFVSQKPQTGHTIRIVQKQTAPLPVEIVRRYQWTNKIILNRLRFKNCSLLTRRKTIAFHHFSVEKKTKQSYLYR